MNKAKVLLKMKNFIIYLVVCSFLSACRKETPSVDIIPKPDEKDTTTVVPNIPVFRPANTTFGVIRGHPSFCVKSS